MGDAGITISLGDALPYVEERLRQLIGKDQASKDTADWFKNLQRVAMIQASQVKCIGMHRPLPLAEIYQPTRLRVKGRPTEQITSLPPQDKVSRSITLGHAIEERVMGVGDFLRREESAVIYAGPGWGKTTFLHHVFLASVARRNMLPVLISLRRPTALHDLQEFVKLSTKIQKREGKSEIILLVDGYDELPVEKRKYVSEAILRYQALRMGPFYLTCREYYQVFEIVAPEARIDGFTRDDQYRYVKAFLGALGTRIDHIAVVDELHDRGFEDFLSHPLLLALACIVKSSSQNVNSRSVIRLLERAIDVLTYRWDEEKGIDRERRSPVDGRDRIQILKQIAYAMKSRHVPEHRAFGLAKRQLDRLQFDKVDPRQVLMETAQFFGIFVPSEEGWEFVHKTLHDFLAAQFWVETGAFATASNFDWNARTAYAACLTQDATSIMEKSLSTQGGVESFVEILSNAPNFDHNRIADALIRYYSQHENEHFYEDIAPNKISAHLKQDFVRLASSKFLDHLVERCASRRGETTDTVAGYCMWELFQRKCKLSVTAYEKALALYKSEEFTFHLIDLGHIRLSSLRPQGVAGALPNHSPVSSIE
jgi:hypothetical protein